MPPPNNSQCVNHVSEHPLMMSPVYTGGLRGLSSKGGAVGHNRKRETCQRISEHIQGRQEVVIQGRDVLQGGFQEFLSR